MRLIYLDYNTTTPSCGAAREAMLPFLYEYYGSPNSNHWTGAAVSESIEDARASVATMIRCNTNDLIFTSGGTESINLALEMGWRALESESPLNRQLLLTTWEHEACYRKALDLASTNNTVNTLVCESPTGWSIDKLSGAIGDRPTLLSLTLADGSTGLIQPIEALKDHLIQTGQRDHVLLHVDACQAAGKIDIDFDRLGADFLSISGHKMYAVKGIGALAIRDGSQTATSQFGEWFERGIRNGMPNVPGIIAIASAAQLVSASIEKFSERCAELFQIFDDMTKQCCDRVFPRLISQEVCLPNTRLYFLPGCSLDNVVQRCPELCLKLFEIPEEDDFSEEQPTRQQPKSVTVPISELDQRRFNSLLSAGLSYAQQSCAVLVSVGWNTTEAEMMHAAEAISETYQQTDLE